jgi:hypothetical protein
VVPAWLKGVVQVHKYMWKLRLLACGAVTLGWLQAVENVDYNQIWFELVLGWLTVMLAGFFSLFGVDITSSLAFIGPSSLPF